MTNYGYARCSTNESRQDISRQTRKLKELGVEESNIYFEYESGAKTDRVQLDRLLLVVKQGDSISALEISRLTRSTKQLCELVDFAKEKRIKLIIGTFVVDCTNDELEPMTHGMILMMGIFAEMERAMTVMRVKSGIENARAKGAVIGRPTTTIANLPPPFIKHYPKYIAKQITQDELASLCKVSRQSVSKYIKIYKEGVG